MSRKKKECNISTVLFSYEGTDSQFNEFLKAVVHDYLTLPLSPAPPQAEIVEKVESRPA